MDGGKGKVVAVSGAVVDVQFEGDELPEFPGVGERSYREIER